VRPDAKASGYLIVARDRKAYLRAKAPSAFCGAVRPDAKASGYLILARDRKAYLRAKALLLFGRL
jgi:23S rRNA-/tRNA-specific pseudouridylate synthase